MCADKKITVPTEGDMGHIQVDESVVALIAFKETVEMDGVVGTSGGLVKDFAAFIRKGEVPKGVRVTRDDEGQLVVDLSIVIEYGRDVRELAAALQVKVMDEVEKMTGNRPKTVNIHLAKVDLSPKEKSAAPQEDEPEPPGEQ